MVSHFRRSQPWCILSPKYFYCQKLLLIAFPKQMYKHCSWKEQNVYLGHELKFVYFEMLQFLYTCKRLTVNQMLLYQLFSSCNSGIQFTECEDQRLHYIIRPLFQETSQPLLMLNSLFCKKFNQQPDDNMLYTRAIVKHIFSLCNFLYHSPHLIFLSRTILNSYYCYDSHSGYFSSYICLLCKKFLAAVDQGFCCPCICKNLVVQNIPHVTASFTDISVSFHNLCNLGQHGLIQLWHM